MDTSKSVAESESVKLNAYENCDAPPSGWVEIPNCRSAWAKRAKAEGGAVQVVIDWQGGHASRRPVLKWYCHPKFIEAPVDKAKNPARVTAGQRAAKTRRPKSAAAQALDFRAFLEQKAVKPELWPILESNQQWGRIAVTHLKDVNAAKIDWLRDMLDACADNYDRRGIMWQWERDGIEGADFYTCARRALAAWRRHNLTDYDAIDKRGMDDADVAWYRKEKTAESRRQTS